MDEAETCMSFLYMWLLLSIFCFVFLGGRGPGRDWADGRQKAIGGPTIQIDAIRSGADRGVEMRVEFSHRSKSAVMDGALSTGAADHATAPQCVHRHLPTICHLTPRKIRQLINYSSATICPSATTPEMRHRANPTACQSRHRRVWRPRHVIRLVHFLAAAMSGLFVAESGYLDVAVQGSLPRDGNRQTVGWVFAGRPEFLESLDWQPLAKTRSRIAAFYELPARVVV